VFLLHIYSNEKVRYNTKILKIHFWKFSFQFLISNVDSRLCVHLKVLEAISFGGTQFFMYIFSWNNFLMFTKHNVFKDSNLQYFVLEILNNQDSSIETLKYNVKFVQSNKQQDDKFLCTYSGYRTGNSRWIHSCGCYLHGECSYMLTGHILKLKNQCLMPCS
jgi:hypothetical protein